MDGRALAIMALALAADGGVDQDQVLDKVIELTGGQLDLLTRAQARLNALSEAELVAARDRARLLVERARSRVEQSAEQPRDAAGFSKALQDQTLAAERRSEDEEAGWRTLRTALHAATDTRAPSVPVSAESVTLLVRELLDPLTVMYGVMETLALYAEELGLEGRQELRQRGQRHFRLAWLTIDQLFEVSRIRRGELSLDPELVDLTELLPGLIDECSILIRPIPVGLRLPDSPLFAWVDPQALQSILLSLFRNVRDHAGASEEPVLVFVDEEDDSVSITVEDNGPGFRLQDDAVGRSSHAVEPSRPGFGLFVSRQFLEALGGSLETGKSERTGGARVTIRLRPAPVSRLAHAH